jgi:hypothetical protein
MQVARRRKLLHYYALVPPGFKTNQQQSKDAKKRSSSKQVKIRQTIYQINSFVKEESIGLASLSKFYRKPSLKVVCSISKRRRAWN